MREIVRRSLSALYIDVPALRPETVGAYTLAVASVAVATALRLALDPYLVGAQFVTFFPAVVITTVISGLGAGFLCAVLSTAAADFFVLAPRFTLYINDPAAVVLGLRTRGSFRRGEDRVTARQLFACNALITTQPS